MKRLLLALALLLAPVAIPELAPVHAQGVVQCRSTASAPTYNEGSTGPLSCDLGGTLRTAASAPPAGTFNNNSDNVATSSDNAKAAAWLYLWDGAAWDRAPGNATDGALVNLGANNDVTVTNATATNLKAEVIGTGTFSVQCTSGCSGTVPIEDEDTFTIGTTAIVPMGCIEATDSQAAGQVAGVKCGADRELDVDIVSITDGSGPLTVDGTVAATQSGTWVLGANSGVDIGDVTINNAGGASAVNIQDGGNSITVDGTVNATIAAGTSGPQKAEDTASATTDVGIPAMCVRDDTPGNTSDTNLDYEPVQCSAGRLWVDASGTTLTVGTHAVSQSGTWVLGANSGVDIGDVTINNAAGASAVNIQDGGNSITVDGTVTATIGNGTTGPQKAEDTASANTDVGIPSMCVRDDTPGNSTDTNLDYEFVQCNGGRVWVDASGVNLTIGTFPDNEPFNVGQINGVTPLMGNGATGTGSQRVTTANDNSAIANWGHGATSSAVPTGATQLGFRSDGGHAAGTASLKTPVICEDSAVVSASASGNNEIVALTASETIYVCGFLLISDGTVGVQFITGTGTACATGETDKSGVMALVANAGFSSFSPFSWMKGAAGDALCIELSLAVQVSGIVSYTKF